MQLVSGITHLFFKKKKKKLYVRHDAPGCERYRNYSDSNTAFKEFICRNVKHGACPDGPVVKTLSFHCRGHGFDPLSGNFKKERNMRT